MFSKLPELIKGRSINQKILAAQTGLSTTTISKLYRGHFQSLDNKTIEAVCKYFGLTTINQLIEIGSAPQ